MNIQIIGTKKCNDTKKALRFFQERGIKYHFLDLKERVLSPGEIDNISTILSPEEMIDTDSKTYRSRGFAYMEFDIIEEILEDNMLLKTPVVRNGRRAVVGYKAEIWQKWIEEKIE